MLRRRARRADPYLVAAHPRRSRRCPCHDGAVQESLEHRIGEPRPTDRRGELELIPASQEHAGGVAQGERDGLVVRLRSSRRVERSDGLDPEIAEDVAVTLAGLGPEARCGRDHHDRGITSARERDEAIEDDPVPDLVLGSADDDDGPVGHGRALLVSVRGRIARAAGRRPNPAAERSLRFGSALRLARGRLPECRGMTTTTNAADGGPGQPMPAGVRGAGDERRATSVHPLRRRAKVVRRALRHEINRLRDRRRILAMTLLISTFGCLAAGIIARGEPAGADARAYWAAVRIWLGGGDPYRPTGPFLPYVYAPWMLPLFAPWALMPWDVAWYVWRGGTILALLWTIHWAYRQRPLETAILVALLGFPIGANLDTGNINLPLTLLLWGAMFTGPLLAGVVWAMATWLKWVPILFLVVLAPRARLWGLLFLALSVLLSLATLPGTVAQLEALLGFGRRP